MIKKKFLNSIFFYPEWKLSIFFIVETLSLNDHPLDAQITAYIITKLKGIAFQQFGNINLLQNQIKNIDTEWAS